ncbi:MAG: imidazole glycerol phosphate synthase subunit HisH [Pseudomonadota bacterium]
MAVIIDYDAGNLRSVQRACAEVGLAAQISADPAAVRRADRVIFPGVGAAGPGMASVRRNGLDHALLDAFAAGTPILGICLGVQISLDYSEEQETKTLGLLPGRVKRFAFTDPSLKVPHMGWNEVRPVRPHPLLEGIAPGDEFYFVHGLYPAPEDAESVFAVADYEHEFACAIGLRNYFGTQFHTEKSGRVGLELLARFAAWDGSHAE